MAGPGKPTRPTFSLDQVLRSEQDFAEYALPHLRPLAERAAQLKWFRSADAAMAEPLRFISTDMQIRARNEYTQDFKSGDPQRVEAARQRFIDSMVATNNYNFDKLAKHRRFLGMTLFMPGKDGTIDDFVRAAGGAKADEMRTLVDHFRGLRAGYAPIYRKDIVSAAEQMGRELSGLKRASAENFTAAPAAPGGIFTPRPLAG